MPKKRASEKHRFPKWDDPIEEQVRFKGMDIGTIHIRFTPRKAKAGWPQEGHSMNEVTDQFHLHFQDEFSALLARCEREIELYFSNFDKVSNSNALYFSRRELLDYLISRKRFVDFSAFSGYLYSNDNAFYGFLKSDGPEILANSGSLWRIRSAQLEKNGAALNKIAASLISGFHPTKRLRKPGPPPKTLDKSYVKPIYDYVLLRMRWMKKLKDWGAVDQAERIFLKDVKQRVNYWKPRDEGWSSFPEDPKITGRYWRLVDRVAKMIFEDRKPGYANPIKPVAQWIGKRNGYNRQLIKCIDDDEVLKSEFDNGGWLSNEMAKRISSRLLGISEEALADILWRDRKSVKKKSERIEPFLKKTPAKSRTRLNPHRKPI